jgi:hypothetical protein
VIHVVDGHDADGIAVFESDRHHKNASGSPPGAFHASTTVTAGATGQSPLLWADPRVAAGGQGVLAPPR